MKADDLISTLRLKLFAGADGLGKSVTGGYTSDLLSDVMGHASEGSVWITVQTHPNVVAIASLKDIAAVIIARDEVPPQETIEKSNGEGIPLLGSSLNSFELSGLIYKMLE